MTQTSETINHHVEAGGVRLDKYLTEQKISTSRTESTRWIQDGFVLVNGSKEKASYKVQDGDEILIHKPSLKTLDLTPHKIDFEIFHEDDDVLVINKPAGLVVHPGAGHYETSLVHGLLHHCQGKLSGIGGVERPGIVHRLDMGTSGVMVVAKNDKAHQSLSLQFQNHEVEKEYRAITLGSVQKEEQTLTHLMKRAEINRKKFVVNQKKGKEAITHVKVLQKNKKASYVSVKIDTGRTHQIRVHLNFIGHPILGDVTYGGTKKLMGYKPEEQDYVRELGRPLLQATKLGFTHPRTKESMSFEAELDQDLQHALEKFFS